MNNKQIIAGFYNSFAAGDAEGMVINYADNIEFKDPAFGLLKGDAAKNMWRMLLKNAELKITANNITVDNNSGTADWIAIYKFSLTGRTVTNRVSAKFEFKDGKSLSTPTILTSGNGQRGIWFKRLPVGLDTVNEK